MSGVWAQTARPRELKTSVNWVSLMEGHVGVWANFRNILVFALQLRNLPQHLRQDNLKVQDKICLVDVAALYEKSWLVC